eukprot:TRINITY_DN32320_c0_g1_i1.p1 TRINITY_DN32320_c0_g1~~TRINITY_DN32320_c0_g1_i1.p1  ORF type:complete len:320 (-),score=61.48 TRINITY_DN32320_c0_g1_i1:180-1139(-)
MEEKGRKANGGESVGGGTQPSFEEKKDGAKERRGDDGERNGASTKPTPGSRSNDNAGTAPAGQSANQELRETPEASTPPAPSNAEEDERRGAMATAKDKERERERVAQEEAVEGEEKERRRLQLRDGLHPLQHRFVLYCTRRQRGAAAPQPVVQSRQLAAAQWEDNIKRIHEFSTVEGFWHCYCHLTRASSLPHQSDFHLFKEGIRPLWEDVNNHKGGKWVIRFKKGIVGRFWENLVLALVGEQLDSADSVCGVVLSMRYSEDLISVWNRNVVDSKGRDELKDSIKHHLNLPPSYLLEYKPHDVALRDMSSFRNTRVWN